MTASQRKSKNTIFKGPLHHQPPSSKHRLAVGFGFYNCHHWNRHSHCLTELCVNHYGDLQTTSNATNKGIFDSWCLLWTLLSFTIPGWTRLITACCYWSTTIHEVGKYWFDLSSSRRQPSTSTPSYPGPLLGLPNLTHYESDIVSGRPKRHLITLCPYTCLCSSLNTWRLLFILRSFARPRSMDISVAGLLPRQMYWFTKSGYGNERRQLLVWWRNPGK